ncbi:MAG: NERD domain-containing protein [Candidatus Doudnabacteria bacterium]|nr:NERD domain-containing protein [Candidatus Doudnabacteria bacterium]
MAKLYQSPEDYLTQQERRHTLASYIPLLGVVLMILVLLAFIARAVSSEYSADFKIAVVLMVGLAVLILAYILLRDYSSAQWQAMRYAKGRSGEQRVLDALRRLDDRYTIFYGGKISKGNIDFIVLRGGILFNIEVKNHSGSIMFDGFEMLRNGEPFPEHGLLGQVISNEKQLKFALYFLPNLNKLKIVSVLVFSNPRAFVSTIGFAKGVYVTHSRLLNSFIESYCK